jgi:hypothetical protein
MSCSIIDSALTLLMQKVPSESSASSPLVPINGAGEDIGGLGLYRAALGRSDELAKQERSKRRQGQRTLGDAQGAEMVPDG